MTNPPQLVVFSDLDGTLLDHETYAWDAAKSALDRLATHHCPVVLTSSKTAAEIVVLQDEMGLAGVPAIVENGAGVIGLSDDAEHRTYDDLRALLNTVPNNLRHQFRGFGDMSYEDVMAQTGLSEIAARLAQQRDFSEPGLWSGTSKAKNDFLDVLSQRGVRAVQGGRFLTLSFGATKADGLKKVAAHYQPKNTVALGDAPNDITMLEAADYGIIVANPHRAPLPLLDGETSGRISRTDEAGPTGWNTAVCALLDQLGMTTGTH